MGTYMNMFLETTNQPVWAVLPWSYPSLSGRRLNPCESGLRNQLLCPSKKKPIGLQNLFATNIHPENDNSVTDHGNFEIAKHFAGLG